MNFHDFCGYSWFQQNTFSRNCSQKRRKIKSFRAKLLKKLYLYKLLQDFKTFPGQEVTTSLWYFQVFQWPWEPFSSINWWNDCHALTWSCKWAKVVDKRPKNKLERGKPADKGAMIVFPISKRTVVALGWVTHAQWERVGCHLARRELSVFRDSIAQIAFKWQPVKQNIHDNAHLKQHRDTITRRWRKQR